MNYLERAFDVQNQVWKYLLVLLCSLVILQVIGAIPLALVILIKVMGSGDIGSALDSISSLDYAAVGIPKNLAFALLMLSTVIVLFGTIVLVMALHQRDFSEVVNGTKKIRIHRFITGFAVWAVLMLLYLIIDYLIYGKELYVWQFDPWQFIPLFFLAFLLIPFQTTSEEFLFRGYLAQGIAGLTKNRWLALCIPGVLFGLIHVGNPEVKEFGFWATMPQYIYFGLFFGLTAILDDGIELPMGMHAANNIFLSLFVTHKSSALQTPALFELTQMDPYKDTMITVLISLLAFVYFARRYRWDLLLNRPLKKPLKDY
jgi:membrane protease YdiL (CAAX protease family)